MGKPREKIVDITEMLEIAAKWIIWEIFKMLGLVL
jgi:hypothetical protein